MSFQPGTSITYRGIDEIVYWAYPAVVVQDTPDLIALYMPAGTHQPDHYSHYSGSERTLFALIIF